MQDAYRDAKTNGFNVTVIKKGQLQLNVDQSLEEVEEAITDIGSKIYHDKIMRERSLDVTTVMKGVFGTGKPTKKRCTAIIHLLSNFKAGTSFLVNCIKPDIYMMPSFSHYKNSSFDYNLHVFQEEVTEEAKKAHF